ncbi:MAG: hypothetical protein RMJ55_14670 [Roseiflexaceae bacterium]|nr:hypothetical protein [Roseiflexus sp.]MDW8214798.1 hypothetical protein [Roseiflexaceae bacterium]
MTDLRGMFVYPWDLLSEGINESIATIRHDLGCTAIALNCNYHSGRFLHPRNRNSSAIPTMRGIINHRMGASAAFTPNSDLYPEGLVPVCEAPLADSGVIEKAAVTAREIGLIFNLWVVVLHNSSLGIAHPELCSRNMYGDIFRYALCPAQPRVRAYARALVSDICAQFKPNALMLESPTYLGVIHGDHHELFLAHLDELAKLLTGLCFCDACCERATGAGIPIRDVLGAARKLSDRLIEDERGTLDPAFSASETVSALLAFPELFAYLRMRSDVVGSLLNELRLAAENHGVKIGVTTSIFTRPASKAWMEGVELRTAAAAVDFLLTVSYFADPNQVRGDIRWVKGLIDERPFQVALNAGHPDALSAEDLTSKALIAANEGAGGIYYYNYGLLTRKRLHWVAAANAALAARQQA